MDEAVDDGENHLTLFDDGKRFRIAINGYEIGKINSYHLKRTFGEGHMLTIKVIIDKITTGAQIPCLEKRN